MKLYYIIFVIAYLTIGFFVYDAESQNQKVADSLKNILENEIPTDSAQFEINRLIASNSTRAEDIILFSEKALAIAINMNGWYHMARAHSLMGDGFRMKGDLVRALESYYTSLDLTEGHVKPVFIAGIYTNIAVVYMIQSDFQNSIHFYNKALNIHRQKNQNIYLADALLNTGELYRTIGQLDSAFAYFNEAESLFGSESNQIGAAYNLGNIGLVYAEWEHYDLAEEKINRAIEILEKRSDYYPITVYQTYLGDIYKEKGELSRALEFVNNAYEIALEYGLKEQIRDAGLKLSELYQESKDYEKAYFYQSQYIVYRDSLNNEETIRKMADLRTEYEVSQKQAEVDILNQQTKNQRILVLGLIVILALVMGLAYVMYKIYRLKLKANQILSKRNKEIEKQRNQLDALNQTKDRFFSIVSHDLRGPVSSFQGVSEILKEMVVEKEFEELENTAGRLEKSSRQLSLLLDNLLGWAQGQQGKFPYNPERLSLSDIFDSTLGIVENMANAKNQKLKYNMNYELELWADRDSCLAIFRNLLGNSIKFTPEGGSIEFSSGKGTEYAVLAVKDSGVGISEEKLSGIFNFEGNRSSWGTHGEKGMGLGLILVHEFVEMNKGKIDVTSKEGRGTTITVRLPLYKNQAVAS